MIRCDTMRFGYQSPGIRRGCVFELGYNDGGQTMKTYMANPDKIERKWYVVDASGMELGRMASEVAKVLRGKNKPQYTPHIDTGD